MKSTGIVRRIDDLGRVVIPKELRRTRGIKTGDPMEVFVQGEAIVLQKYRQSEACTLCGDEYANRVPLKNNGIICEDCLAEAWAVIRGESHA